MQMALSLFLCGPVVYIQRALVYYWDHKNELDQDIEMRLERVAMLKLRCQNEGSC